MALASPFCFLTLERRSLLTRRDRRQRNQKGSGRNIASDAEYSVCEKLNRIAIKMNVRRPVGAVHIWPNLDGRVTPELVSIAEGRQRRPSPRRFHPPRDGDLNQQASDEIRANVDFISAIGPGLERYEVAPDMAPDSSTLDEGGHPNHDALGNLKGSHEPLPNGRQEERRLSTSA